MDASRWLFAGDRGGTFTDVIGLDPAGTVRTEKLLSVSDHYPDALIEGIRRLLGLNPGGALPEARISTIRIGTTVATNALLERRGAPTGLLITRGFGDLLEIGHQARPRLFDLDIIKPQQLYSAVAEVPERVAADGAVLEPLDGTAVTVALRGFREQGIESLAVALLHGWLNPDHERAIGTLAHGMGFRRVSLSHQCMRVIKLVGRAQTTVVDAYLSPVLADYVASVRRFTGAIPLEFMQSGGGLADAAGFSGKDAVLSGPAGGVVAVAGLAQARDYQRLIGFDMGGTSTDVCRFGGTYERQQEVETAGIRYQADMLQIETVAAGGGSILHFDGQRLRVGPQSAGADPGPACYGRGGPLTITDANLLLGRIDPQGFPRVFGVDGAQGLDAAATRAAFDDLTRHINAGLGRAMTPEAVALGYLRIANEQMANPIRALSVARGYDVRHHALCCFGGAGALHACDIARLLGMREVVIHPLAGLFSAWGIALARRRHAEERSLLEPFESAVVQQTEPLFAELEARARQALGPAGEVTLQRAVDLRPRGSDSFLTVPLTDFDATRSRYLAEYEQRFGFRPDAERLELVNLRVTAEGSAVVDFDHPVTTGHDLAGMATSRVVLDGETVTLPCYRREALTPGPVPQTPCLIQAAHYTVLVTSDFDARLLDSGELLLHRRETGGEQAAANPINAAHDAEADPVLLEVFNHLFMSVAEQMGAALVNTAHSVNMKERLDFSCALFDARGHLVANAPHIPVHLGAMGATVQALLKSVGEALAPGQVYVTNHPARGGSHLPDITLISPLFLRQDGVLPDAFVATRGHHADVGGRTPGSMDPFATNLEQEGVVFDNFLLVSGGRLREAQVRRHLAGGAFPARNIDERISDLLAQLAANQLGARELTKLTGEHGLARIRAYMAHVQTNAGRCVARTLDGLLGNAPQHRFERTDRLDDGTPLRVVLELRRDTAGAPELTVDFAGTAAWQPNSFNAPPAVARAALVYVLRCLVADDIPLNDGCLAAVRLKLPPDSLLCPPPDAAVVAGNVETAQRLVDLLLGALGVAAASQGTMNNLLFGWDGENGGRQYYETIGGGAGATATAPGASGVQVHMTNTRITDPEVLEWRLRGVRLHRFALRTDSGGRGQQRGGDGLIREFEILAPCDCTLLTQRRSIAPFGLAGGEDGAPGVNRLRRADGEEQALPATGHWQLQPGDRLTIETPGGGGYGPAAREP